MPINAHKHKSYMHDNNLSRVSLYCSFRHIRIRVWGLIENLKKGCLLLILGIGTTLKGHVWTCLGNNSLCLDCDLVMSSVVLSTIWSPYMVGTYFRAQVYLNPFTQGKCYLMYNIFPRNPILSRERWQS